MNLSKPIFILHVNKYLNVILERTNNSAQLIIMVESGRPGEHIENDNINHFKPTILSLELTFMLAKIQLKILNNVSTFQNELV